MPSLFTKFEEENKGNCYSELRQIVCLCNFSHKNRMKIKQIEAAIIVGIFRHTSLNYFLDIFSYASLNN